MSGEGAAAEAKDKHRVEMECKRLGTTLIVAYAFIFNGTDARLIFSTPGGGRTWLTRLMSRKKTMMILCRDSMEPIAPSLCVSTRLRLFLPPWFSLVWSWSHRGLLPRPRVSFFAGPGHTFERRRRRGKGVDRGVGPSAPGPLLPVVVASRIERVVRRRTPHAPDA